MQTGARQLFDGLPDPTLVVGQQDQVVAWSRAAERVFGIPAHDAEGRVGVLEQGINFLEKPYSARALGLAVRRVLDGLPA